MVIGGFRPFTLSDFPGHTAAIVFTVGCNFRCGYCHNPELAAHAASCARVSEDEVMRFLEMRRGKLDGLVVTGGEPTLQPDLADFLTQVRELGYAVKLDSNGTRPEVLEQLFAAGLVDYVAMDIKAPLERYAEITGTPVDVEAIRRSVRLIIGSGLDHEFRTTVVEGQLDAEDFRAMGELVAGAQRYYIQKFVPTKANDLSFLTRQAPANSALADFSRALSGNVARCAVR